MVDETEFDIMDADHESRLDDDDADYEMFGDEVGYFDEMPGNK